MTTRTTDEALRSALDEFDNVRWDDVWANLRLAGAEDLADWTRTYVGYVRADIEAALVRTPETLDAARTHEPDDFHEYGPLECSVCGQRGQIQVSIEPQRAAALRTPKPEGDRP